MKKPYPNFLSNGDKMKKTLLVVVSLTFSGCHFLGDPIPPTYPAQVITIDNNVCVTVASQAGEEVSMILIHEVGNEKNKMEKFFEPDGQHFTLPPDKCIPTFNYKFEAGKAYNFSVDLTSVSEKSRFFSTQFVLSESMGKMKVSVTK